jgi:hypothetical protein
MVDATGRTSRPATAVLFAEPTADCLIDAIHRFERTVFRADDLLAHAQSFSIPVFKRRLRGIVEEFLASRRIVGR